MKLYDFGAEFRGRKPETLKLIAWPVYAWTCYIPDNVNPQLNILEKLILSLVKDEIAITKVDVMDVLVKQLHLNEELVKNVLEECTTKYFNQSFKNKLKLKVDAEKVLDAIEGYITPEMIMSDKAKKIYLFQDAVTNMVIPCFNIENLSSEGGNEFSDDKNYVILKANNYEQPKTAAINNALRLWGRILKAMNSGETVTENKIDLEREPIDFKDHENFGEEEVQVKTLADKEDNSKQIEAITIFDDKPIKYFTKGYLAFNPSNPTEIEIISPFGSLFDNWFMKLVNKLRVSDKSFSDELELFLLEKREQFKDTVAFENHLNIQLFDDFPIICNEKKYACLKKAIKELSKDVERIRKGEDESTNFAKNMRTAIEVMFRIVIQENPDIAKIKTEYHGKNDFLQYKFDLCHLVEINRLEKDIKQRYIRQSIYNNMVTSYEGNTKDYAALILLYANRNPSSSAMKFVKDYSNLFIEIIDLINLGNNAAHGGDKYNDMYFSKDAAERYYSKYEIIVRTLYTYFLEGEK